MDKLKALSNATVILATPEQRSRWGYEMHDAERAIRSARRQVARYGDEARDGFMRQAQTDDERTIMTRALSTSTRVTTNVYEWISRG